MSTPGPDYSLLDHLGIGEFIFYPRREWSPPPPGARDCPVPVAGGIDISCRFYPGAPTSPLILFFHGNGEVACDYDAIAPLYNREGAGLFVADYRGYGGSGGRPSFATMMADAHPIFLAFQQVAASAQNRTLFVMGRSLGSHSAVELACHYPDKIGGLILESGSANPVRLLRLLGFPLPPTSLQELEASYEARVRSLTLPLLILHGEWDELVPLGEAVRFYEAAGSPQKKLEIIPQAGHNDIMLVGLEQYFGAIREFVQGEVGRGGA